MDQTTIGYIVIGVLTAVVIGLTTYLIKNRNNGSSELCPSFLKNIEWRRAVKHFTPGSIDYQPILNAIQNAPSSFGIQPYKVIILTNQLLKSDIRPYCYDQAQIEECEVLLVFCAIKNVDARMEEYLQSNTSAEAQAVRPMMTQFLTNLPDKVEWAKKQAYIGLGFAMAAATELKIASCPMEGFLHDKVAEILATDPNYIPSVFLALGRHSDSPDSPRFRFPMDNLFQLED